jgi:glycosyltransferase involved in cell wall biosynthesis
MALRRIVRARGIGLIHSHHRFSGLVGRIVGASLGIPCVSTVHDLASGKRVLTRLGLGRSVIVFSAAVESHLVDHFGLPKSRVHRVPMGCSVPVLRTPSTPGGPVVGFFGRLEWEKGPDLFVRAGARVVRAVPDAELRLAGVGDLLAETKDLAERLGVGGRTRFLGWQAAVEQAMLATAVVVVPSRREGFGRTVLEAMLLGRPVVATRVGGIPELIEDGVTGRLVPPDNVDAIAEATLELVQDAERATRMGAAARAAIGERLSLEAMAEAVERVYVQAAGA